MKKIVWIAIIVVVVGVGIWLLSSSGSNLQPTNIQDNNSTTTTGVVPDNGPTSTSPVPTSTDQTNGSKKMTIADVAIHNNAQSCFSVISGMVYDLTSYISQHPGGSQRILTICGKDGTSAFNNKHSGQSKSQQTLIQFKIGVLVK